MSDVRDIKRVALTLVREGKTKDQITATLNELYPNYSFWQHSNNVFMSSDFAVPQVKII